MGRSAGTLTAKRWHSTLGSRHAPSAQREQQALLGRANAAQQRAAAALALPPLPLAALPAEHPSPPAACGTPAAAAAAGQRVGVQHEGSEQCTRLQGSGQIRLPTSKSRAAACCRRHRRRRRQLVTCTLKAAACLVDRPPDVCHVGFLHRLLPVAEAQRLQNPDVVLPRACKAALECDEKGLHRGVHGASRRQTSCGKGPMGLGSSGSAAATLAPAL